MVDKPLAPGPTQGQHTREILAELGYDVAAIAQLIADGVVRTGDEAS
jgi:crotonobetainyl-CoA:carnitine CoA-transferase CaiB-like acyl-CoA transferase